jgi:hypothetical protein
MLEMPTGMSVDTNDTYALMSPYYRWYGQDTWRVTTNLTLTLGLRMEYERGATERYNRALSYFDPNLELPITAAVQAAYARNPLPELPASQFCRARRVCLRRAERRTPRAMARRIDVAAQNLGGAAIGSEDCRSCWLWHVLRHPKRNESSGRSIRLRSCYQYRADYGFWPDMARWRSAEWVSPLTDPFPVRSDGTRFDVPLRDALGAHGARRTRIQLHRF